MRVEDLSLLAVVYGTTPDRLFFAPGDHKTPEMMARAYAVLTTADEQSVARWLELGELLRAGAGK